MPPQRRSIDFTFTNEVINIKIGHEVYTFLDGFSRYH